MMFFLCAAGRGGDFVSEHRRVRYESVLRKNGQRPSWQKWEGFHVLTASDSTPEGAAISYNGTCVAVGTVRLDNRSEIERWLDHRHDRRAGDAVVRDLDLVLQLISTHGAKYVPKILGDFAFVVWNTATHRLVAASDAFAVKAVYYTTSDGMVAFASHSEVLAPRSEYSVQYLAERVAYCNPISPGVTVFAGVQMLPAGNLATVQGCNVELREYWSADHFEPQRRCSIGVVEAAALTRQLLTTSVALRLAPNGGNWAELSGGLDSSGVVSIAQQLFQSGLTPHGLDGTLTYVDRPDVPDRDRAFAGDVSRKWAVHNERLTGIERWYSDVYTAPSTDYPDGYFSTFPRNLQACKIMKTAGARVLLTGLGGDELFGGSRFYYADLLAQGDVRLLVKELAGRIATQRRSLWPLFWRSILLPFLPRALSDRLELARHVVPLPDWYRHSVFRGYGISNFGESNRSAQPRQIGRMYHNDHVVGIESLIGRGGWQVMSNAVDVRHPFLYRPLVEFALQMPPQLSMNPTRTKPILRTALHGTLPERTQVTNRAAPWVAGRSPVELHSFLRNLVRTSILAELGIVDGAKLRNAVERRVSTSYHQNYFDAIVDQTLEVEAWLQERSGRSGSAAWEGTQYQTRVGRAQCASQLSSMRHNLSEVDDEEDIHDACSRHQWRLRS